LTELLVEPMPNYGIFEYTRQRAEEAMASNKPPPEDPDHIPWARGSVEYEQAMRERERRQRKAEEASIAQPPAEAAAAQAQQVHDFRARLP
jgi:hypothetical protein